MATTEAGEKASRGHFLGRKVYQKLSRTLLPTDLKPEDVGDGENGVERAKSLLRDGTGLVIIYTHPSRTDTYRLMALWKYDEFAERRCLTPIAYHQFNRLVAASAWPTGLEFYPIVTQETIARGKNDSLPENHGSRRFLDVSVKALSKGGIVLLAPTTTRTSELVMPPGKLRPTDMLLNTAYYRGCAFAVLFTGFEINSVTAYESASGINIFKKYTLHTGNCLKDNYILEQLAEFRKQKDLTENPRRPFNDTDQWLYETQLPPLVPPAYRPKH